VNAPKTTRATRILGYAEPLVTTPGGKIELKVSASDIATYRCEIVRFTCCDPDPRGPGLRYETLATPAPVERTARFQPIATGSQVRIASRSLLGGLRDFGIAALIWPTRPDGGMQTIASLGDPARGHGLDLHLDARGAVAITLGDGADREATLSTQWPLRARAWSLVAARYDAASGMLELRQAPLRPDSQRDAPAHAELRVPFGWSAPADATITLAARPGDAPRHFDGKIERPRLTRAIASLDALAALLARAAPEADEPAQIVGWWDFSRGIATRRIHDLGPLRLDGEIVNLPARGVTGHNWDGSQEDWRHAPEQYGAIHFHADDIEDCGWQGDLTLSLPQDARSGFYAARLVASGAETFVPFFVTAAPGRPRARIAVVAATATYLAYANTHVKFDSLNSENLFESALQIGEQEAYLNAHRELGYSTYDTHADGSGVFFSSPRRPLLTMQPGVYTFNYVNDSHVLAWLEAIGEDYDVITDDAIHAHGLGLLAPYRVVVTGSHPEYFSTAMWDAFDAYQRGGGRHMYLGGNGFYWRIAYSENFPGVIEMRRGIAGVRTWEGEPGENHLMLSGEPAGLWRSAGRAPQLLCGVGFSATIFNRSTYYRRTPESERPDVAFVFAGVGRDERIGDFGLRGGGAAGLEIDRWDPVLGSPPDGVVLASSENVGIGGLLSGEEFITTTRALDAEQNAKVRADMTLFATPGGGAVFSVGSIAWPTSLCHAGWQNNVARITGNVLRRFLDPTPIVLDLR
jgi:N,N-dimethylformamidase